MSIPYELVLLLALIKAGVLWLILYLSAKDEADLDFTKLAIIAGILMFAFYLEEALLKKYIGMWTTLPLAALVVYLLVQYCWVSLRKALPVAAIFVAVDIGLNMGVAKLYGNIGDTEQALWKEQQVSSSRKIGQALGSAVRELEQQRQDRAEKDLVEKGLPLATSRSPGWDDSKTNLAVTARMSDKDGNAVLLVNDQPVIQGDIVRVRHKQQIYQWRFAGQSGSEILWEPVQADRLP